MKKPGGNRIGGKSFSGDKKSGGKFKKDFSDKKPFAKKDGERSFRKSDDDSKPRRRFSDDKPSGDKPFKKSFGDKPAYGKSSAGKSFGERKSYGDKPSGERKSYGEKKSFGDKPFGERKSYGDKKPFGDRGEKKSFGDKPFGERKSYGDKKPFGDRGEKKSFGDKPFGERKSYGDKKPFGDRGEKKSYGDKPFGERKSYGDKKPFGDRGEKKSFGDKPFGERKSYGGKKPFGDRGEKKSFGDKPFGERKSYGDKKPFGDKPFGDKKPFGERKSFGDKKPFGDKNSGPAKPYTGKSYGDSYSGFRKHEEMRKMKEELGDDYKSFESEEKTYGFARKTPFKKHAHKPTSAEKAKPTAFKDNGPIRLNRYIANTGICSRREADDLIKAGVVKVNGQIVTELGTKIGPNDQIHYGDQLLRREKMVYVLLNKPKDYITTTDDPQERKTVLQLVEDAGTERIYPVGRLDRQTTGLLLLTNDGDLTSRLMHPKYGVRKIYHVTLDKNLRKEDFETIEKGFELEDGFIKADELSYVGDGLDKKQVGIVMHSGRNRIVRRIFEHLGYAVIGLDRVIYAELTKKNLPRSRWRYLTVEEVGMLKMLVGGTKKGQAPDKREFKKKRSKKDE